LHPFFFATKEIMEPVANILFYIDRDVDEKVKLAWNTHLIEREQIIGRHLSNYVESSIADERFLESIILDSLSLPIKFLKQRQFEDTVNTLVICSLDKLIDIRKYLDHAKVSTKIDDSIDIYLKESKLSKIDRGLERLDFYVKAIRNKQFEAFSIPSIRFEDNLPYYEKENFQPTKMSNEILTGESEEMTKKNTGLELQVDIKNLFNQLEKLNPTFNNINKPYSQRQVALFYTYLEITYNLPELKIEPIGNKLANFFGHTSKHSGHTIYRQYRELKFKESRLKKMSKKKLKDFEKIAPLLQNYKAAFNLLQEEWSHARENFGKF